MLITEYIAQLQAIAAKHGDLKVVMGAPGVMGACREAIGPYVANIHVNEGRERSMRLNVSIDHRATAGETVVKVGY